LGLYSKEVIMNFDFITSWLTKNLVTSPGAGTSRIRADISQTGFWENREFRIFPPIDTTSGSVCLKITAPIDFILRFQSLECESDALTMKAYRASDGGLESGTFTATDYQLPNNIMSDTPEYTGQVVYSIGGTWTPTDTDLYRDILSVTVSNATAQQSTVGVSSVPERGLKSDTYYLVFSGGGVGNFYSLIEERP